MRNYKQYLSLSLFPLSASLTVIAHAWLAAAAKRGTTTADRIENPTIKQILCSSAKDDIEDDL